MGRFLNLRTLTFFGAAVAGLLTVILLTRYISLRESQMLARLSQEGVTHVMLAKRDIPAARTITSVDVERTPWPKKAFPKAAFHDLKSLKDRVAARMIIAGEPWKARIPGSNSVATPLELLRYLVEMEKGELIDPYSSLAIKRLIYLSEGRFGGA